MTNPTDPTDVQALAERIELLNLWLAQQPSLAPPSPRLAPHALKDATEMLLSAYLAKDAHIATLTARIAALEAEPRETVYHVVRDEAEKDARIAELQDEAVKLLGWVTDAEQANGTLKRRCNASAARAEAAEARATEAERERDVLAENVVRQAGYMLQCEQQRDEARAAWEKAEGHLGQALTELDTKARQLDAYNDQHENRTLYDARTIVDLRAQVARLRAALEGARPYVVERISRGNNGFVGEVDAVLSRLDAALTGGPDGE